MNTISKLLQSIDCSSLAVDSSYLNRCEHVMQRFTEQFGTVGFNALSLFSAPGRVEIGGNHTDHQHGCVLAAAINLDVLGAAATNNRDEIRILSEGYPLITIDTNNFSMREEDKNSSPAFIRGVADGFRKRGYAVHGFDAYVTSEVLTGSGLSSSAAFEVWIGTAINGLFNNGEVSAIEIAQIGQYAENAHYGKPCGLMDQMASSVGSVVAIDFKDPKAPIVQKISTDLSDYALCIIDSGADHAGLTTEYAAIPTEMCAVASALGKDVLRNIDKAAFIERVPELRQSLGDRAVLRAFHFFADNERAVQKADALQTGDLHSFFTLIKESGNSSFMYLQNVSVAGNTRHQDLAIVLALCGELLGADGACRIQGGGFAGTVEAFVPITQLEAFRSEIEAALGAGSCHVLSIREAGAIQIR